MGITENSYGQKPAIMTPVVTGLLVANVALSLLGFQMMQFIFKWFALWPAKTDLFQPWQWITYGFLHGNFGHLFFNMFALWMFGSAIERVWGSRAFFIYYLVCVIGAAWVQTLVNWNGTVPTVGASGGVFGLLLAFGWMFPRAPIYFIFFPFPIQARYFVLMYGAVELALGFSRFNTGVAHFAHLGGMLFGYLLILYWLGRLPLKPKRFLRFR